MTIIVVLFNLKAGVQASDYEAWAKSTDLPTVNSLKSVDQCRLLRTNGVMGSELPAPYQYIETIEVNSFSGFHEDLAGPLMQRITEEFKKFADKPLLIVSQELP
jgi:REDY-like protein HapK